MKLTEKQKQKEPKATSHKLIKLLPRELQRYNYRDFTIEEESAELFAVRYFDGCIDHDFKPWCRSVKEAMEVVDKIIRDEQLTCKDPHCPSCKR